MLSTVLPDRDLFASDPGGYSRSAWMRWAMVAALNGIDIDPQKSPTSEDLKNPVLWLAHAEAMTQAALVLVKHQPTFATMPLELRGVCDSQYCAVALMLVGYSLEVCLKAMIILRDGIDTYAKAEQDRKYHHHKLHDLADFIDGLDGKEVAILKMLSHFVSWAGRYPDPGAKYIDRHEHVFELSERHQVTARDVFALAGKIIGYVRKLTDVL